jgi:dihydroorotate dehydrogenase
VIAGGVHEPIDAIELQSHGADCVLVDTGLIYSGPGLPKRINEAVLYASLAKSRELISSASESVRPPLPIQKYTWFWSLVLGAAMLLGAVLAFGIASTRVILPYDEVFVGMSRHELDMINPRLLAFMQHDRVTLSGTMFAIAALYLFLSWYGIRQGMHWAMVAVLTSAFFGFVSFFWFLGFGYFDPFHAFVTTIMFQFLLMAWQGDLGQAQLTSLPNLRETPAWRAAQWGQLLFVIHGAVLVGAGVVISGVGCTDVFVREDLQFMDTCPGDLSLANPRLIPLIAHDRASFGGMLITTGLAVLLTALWGFRQGMRWQWWMLLLAGIPAYILAIGVHWAVGYTSWWHLAPAYGGLTLLVTGLALLWPWLGRVDPVHRDEWNRLLSS